MGVLLKDPRVCFANCSKSSDRRFWRMCMNSMDASCFHQFLKIHMWRYTPGISDHPIFLNPLGTKSDEQSHLRKSAERGVRYFNGNLWPHVQRSPSKVLTPSAASARIWKSVLKQKLVAHLAHLIAALCNWTDPFVPERSRENDTEHKKKRRHLRMKISKEFKGWRHKFRHKPLCIQTKSLSASSSGKAYKWNYDFVVPAAGAM